MEVSSLYYIAITFIGELFHQDLLKRKIIFSIIAELLDTNIKKQNLPENPKNPENPEENNDENNDEKNARMKAEKSDNDTKAKKSHFVLLLVNYRN